MYFSKVFLKIKQPLTHVPHVLLSKLHCHVVKQNMGKHSDVPVFRKYNFLKKVTGISCCILPVLVK